jgi:hypothetical protein
VHAEQAEFLPLVQDPQHRGHHPDDRQPFVQFPGLVHAHERLPPGTATAANQADYSDAHVRRLGLIRALIDVGRLSVAKTREVLAAVGAGDISSIDLMGTAQYAVIPATPTDPDHPRPPGRPATR